MSRKKKIRKKYFFPGCSKFGKIENDVLKESETFSIAVYSERESKFSPYSSTQGTSYWLPGGSLVASKDKTQHLQLDVSRGVVIEMVGNKVL